MNQRYWKTIGWRLDQRRFEKRKRSILKGIGEDYVRNRPFVEFRVSPGYEALPAEVFQEVWRYVGQMLTYERDASDLVGDFEESKITIGHTPEEQQELKEYYSADTWPNVQGGEPVAHWRSGISVGCDQELFVMPDGSFEWTEP